MLTAEQMMCDSVYTVLPTATLKEAIQILIENRVSGLPVVDTDGKLVGIISEYALLAIVYDHQLNNETVVQHMTTDVLSVEASVTINQIADLMIAHRVRRTPVTREGCLVGMVTRRDVLRSLYNAKSPVCTA